MYCHSEIVFLAANIIFENAVLHVLPFPCSQCSNLHMIHNEFIKAKHSQLQKIGHFFF